MVRKGMRSMWRGKRGIWDGRGTGNLGQTHPLTNLASMRSTPSQEGKNPPPALQPALRNHVTTSKTSHFVRENFIGTAFSGIMYSSYCLLGLSHRLLSMGPLDIPKILVLGTFWSSHLHQVPSSQDVMSSI